MTNDDWGDLVFVPTEILETLKYCSDLNRTAKESLSQAQVTQLETLLYNSMGSRSTIEQLYVGLQMVLTSLEKVADFAKNENTKIRDTGTVTVLLPRKT